MPIVVNDRIVIPDAEIDVTSLRASGPGGQHVNKTESAIRLRFDAARSAALDDETRFRLRAIAGRRMTAAGDIVIVAQQFRSREANRRDAVERLVELIRKAATRLPARHRTKMPRSAKRARRKAKALRGDTKRLRSRVGPSED